MISIVSTSFLGDITSSLMTTGGPAPGVGVLAAGVTAPGTGVVGTERKSEEVVGAVALEMRGSKSAICNRNTFRWL